MQCKTKLLRLVRVKDSTVQESKDSTGQEQKKAQYNYKSEKEHSVRVKERGMRIISNTRQELKTRQSKSQKSQRSMLAHNV